MTSDAVAWEEEWPREHEGNQERNDRETDPYRLEHPRDDPRDTKRAPGCRGRADQTEAPRPEREPPGGREPGNRIAELDRVAAARHLDEPRSDIASIDRRVAPIDSRAPARAPQVQQCQVTGRVGRNL